jgi:hypothetical protein
MAGEFDTLVLRRRVEQWCAEAERVPDRHMRAFCLREAWECVRRLLIASGTPIIREHSECPLRAAVARNAPCAISRKGALTVRTPASGTISHRSKSIFCAPCATVTRPLPIPRTGQLRSSNHPSVRGAALSRGRNRQRSNLNGAHAFWPRQRAPRRADLRE